MSKRFHSAVVLACLLLSACASTTISSDYKLPPDRRVGLAAGSITFDSMRGKYRVFVENVDSGGGFRFEIGESQVTPIALFSSITDEDLKIYGRPFATELPAGKYKITGWGVAAGAIRATSGLVVGVPFTVEAGKTTYMGNFHFVGRLMPFTGGSMTATLKDEAARDIPVLKKRFPIIATTVPIRVAVVAGTELPLIGGYGKIADPVQVYAPVAP